MDIPENPVSGEWKTPPALASLTEAQRAAALERFGMIRTHLEDGVLLTVLAISTGIACRTLSRWVSLYGVRGATGQRTDLRVGASLVRDKGRSSPRATASGTEKEYRPSTGIRKTLDWRMR